MAAFCETCRDFVEIVKLISNMCIKIINFQLSYKQVLKKICNLKRMEYEYHFDFGE